jgi:hypothetical protein
LIPHELRVVFFFIEDTENTEKNFHRIYCASGEGKILVVSVDGEKLSSLGGVPDEPLAQYSEGFRSRK